MGSYRFDGVTFRVYPEGHDPPRVHGRYQGIVVIVELGEDRVVRLARRRDAIQPGDAKRNHLRHILTVASRKFDCGKRLMPEAAKIAVTDAEIDAALSQARKYAKFARRVAKASYSEAVESVRLVFDDGASYTIPRRLLQGLAGAASRELRRIQIVGGGTGLLWPLLDVNHYVPSLLEGVYGTEKWMTALQRRRGKLRLVNRERGPKQRR